MAMGANPDHPNIKAQELPPIDINGPHSMTLVSLLIPKDTHALRCFSRWHWDGSLPSLFFSECEGYDDFLSKALQGVKEKAGSGGSCTFAK